MYGYIQGLRHFAVVGRSGTGKSSLINAFRGLTNNDPEAARVGVNETTADVTRYPDPRNPKCVWYDVPGAGTLNIPDWQYFKDQGIYMFDAVIVLYADRFTSTDIALLKTCRNCSIPTFIVRSKSDQYIRNIRRDSGYETDPEDNQSRFTPGFVRAEEKARDKFINETTADVKKNLEAAGLRPKRVYLVSRSVMMKVVSWFLFDFLL
ncbi:interferon-inducible GTPase-domain-containing protein [Collybia nuda]|uniref:Interferon-inducible GTPase-domain-containing protein n=1 Tax=Collybia nuda TaxID=64659 RepID=A0A9P5Y7W8_9AGAR|nr:interferon-inducible GTPase-domain-containing protein [Collybia nuda]